MPLVGGPRKPIRPIIKCHGGKWYQREWIIGQLPTGYNKKTFVEPYGGGASVLLNKKRSKVEVLGDKDLGLANIYLAIRDHGEEFIDILRGLKYDERTFILAVEKDKPGYKFATPLDHAVNEYILRRMSRGGLRKSLAWSERTRGGKPGDVNAWETSIEQLPLVHARLQGVEIVHGLALKILQEYDSPDTVAYVDPTYLQETRVSKRAYGKNEMSVADHIALGRILTNYQGQVMLSGYPSKLYDRIYAKWRTVSKITVNNASQSKIKPMKTEVLWMNY